MTYITISTDEDTESQISKVVCPNYTAGKGQSWRPNSAPAAPEAESFMQGADQPGAPADVFHLLSDSPSRTPSTVMICTSWASTRPQISHISVSSRCSRSVGSLSGWVNRWVDWWRMNLRSLGWGVCGAGTHWWGETLKEIRCFWWWVGGRENKQRKRWQCNK